MKQRILNILIVLDQAAWVIVTLGKGHPDETISAAAWRMEQEGKLAGRVYDIIQAAGLKAVPAPTNDIVRRIGAVEDGVKERQKRAVKIASMGALV